MNSLIEICIPKDTVNDDEVLIADLLFADGDAVAEGEAILVYETSKATVEVAAPADGRVAYRCAPGDYVPVGGVAAVIADGPAEAAPAPGPDLAAPGVADPSEPGLPVFSEAAERYLRAKDIDPALFAGRDMVGLADVLALEAGEDPDGRIPLVILGGGGHGLVVGDLVAGNPSFRLLGYLDDNKPRGATVDGRPVLGRISDLDRLCREHPLAVCNAVGFVSPDPALRVRLFDRAAEAGALLPPFVHPSATVDPRAVLGRGVQVHAGAVVGPEAVLEDGAMINTKAVISHHCRVGRHTHVAPGAVLAGAVKVGEGCLIGMGVTAYLGIAIGARCVIENGAALFRSVPEGTRVAR
ncbi:NeuD/PglB/VioB family sugar acetyltransferase [Pseudodesulfovibrio sp.]|uniref:NeuD/PglB/VioB family sugar acetyltransferase n=1 Tax=Pseudodesulfovibrio sp. TaxID=2035812 RepID=UPI00261A4DF1|nr:NeuD/PglB/VioB family sugar acetyltransferase [Pseudodesulfovibrio sp.]MDD3312097.1 NeuD/PglB/VioB family sugar acetyltransferase [Pseudodesulfovibrio sp.]